MTKYCDKTFEEVTEEIKDIEGEYSDHPSDPGGKTRWGIPEWLARAYNYEGKMQDLPWSKAKEIYWKEFWQRNYYDKLEDRIVAMEVFEQAVNLPTVYFKNKTVLRANIHLQQAYVYTSDNEIKIDGIVGEETLGAVNNCEKIIMLYNIMNGMQARYYLDIIEEVPKLKDFIRGWFNKRINIKRRR